MNKHEDQFFEMFRSGLTDYSAEVPASVYSGIRGKMKKDSFFAFSWTSLNIWYLALVGGVAAAAFWPSGEERAESLAVKSIERMDEGIYKPNNALAFASAAEEMGQEEEAVDFTETFAEEHTTETPILEQGLTDEGQMSAQDVVAETPVASEEVVEEVLAEEEVIEAPEVEVAEVEVEKNTFAANFLKKFKLNFKEEQEKEKDTWVLKVPVNE